MKLPATFIQEARARCRPEAECVALLFGRDDAVTAWRWVRNAAASPVAFRIDPEELYTALREAEELGLDLLAIFHTHPGPPVPSAQDLRHMALWRVVWVIADIYTWEVAAWRLGRGLEKEPLEIYSGSIRDV
ncbi:MAG: M67 family metallopeptidase [Pyrobaculum sp.]